MENLNQQTIIFKLPVQDITKLFTGKNPCKEQDTPVDFNERKYENVIDIVSGLHSNITFKRLWLSTLGVVSKSIEELSYYFPLSNYISIWNRFSAYSSTKMAHVIDNQYHNQTFIKACHFKIHNTCKNNIWVTF